MKKSKWGTTTDWGGGVVFRSCEGETGLVSDAISLALGNQVKLPKMVVCRIAIQL